MQQPSLENRLIRIEPLDPTDFERLYAVAADPLLWEQHPNKNRYRREEFETYFRGALDSRSAVRVFDNTDGRLIGCSRFYDIDPPQRQLAIGYTFVARSHWGGQSNRALKSLMLGHAFDFVERVIFHIGVGNLRSRKAMEKLGGVLIGEVAMSYYGESSHPNAIYKIDKGDWAMRS